MPYISENNKEIIDNQTIGQFNRNTVGELVYAIYRLCLNVLPEKPSFVSYAVVMGALVCTMLELYRRKIAPYEDEKIKDNGDI